MPLIIYSTKMYAPIGIVHVVNGFILDGYTSDTLAKNINK